MRAGRQGLGVLALRVLVLDLVSAYKALGLDNHAWLSTSTIIEGGPYVICMCMYIYIHMCAYIYMFCEYLGKLLYGYHILRK